MIDPVITLAISLSLALLSFTAARHKLAGGRRFEAQLAAYRLLPEAALPAVARVLPLFEMALALLLLLPFTRLPAAILAATLLTAYGVAMLINLQRGRSEIDCGCGDRPQALSVWLLARNIVLAAGALVLVFPVAARSLALADLALLLLLTALLSTTYQAVEQLVRNHSNLVRGV